MALGSARLGSRKGATTCVSHDVRLLCQQAVKAYEADTPAVPAGGSRGASARLVKGGNASPLDPLKNKLRVVYLSEPLFFSCAAASCTCSLQDSGRFGAAAFFLEYGQKKAADVKASFPHRC